MPSNVPNKNRNKKEGRKDWIFLKCGSQIQHVKGGELGLDAGTADESAPWADRRKDVVGLWEELVGLLSATASDQ